MALIGNYHGGLPLSRCSRGIRTTGGCCQRRGRHLYRDRAEDPRSGTASREADVRAQRCCCARRRPERNLEGEEMHESNAGAPAIRPTCSCPRRSAG